MERTPGSVVQPDILKENKLSIHGFLRDSYTQAKKQFQGGINAFRDELRGIRDTAEACFDFFALPINNFLKDMSQMDRDFQEAPGMETTETGIHIFTITEALSKEGPMEENY